MGTESLKNIALKKWHKYKQNITENRLEANDEHKDFDNIVKVHRYSSEMVQIV